MQEVRYCTLLRVLPNRGKLANIFSARKDVVATGAEGAILRREATLTLGVSVVHEHTTAAASILLH